MKIKNEKDFKKMKDYVQMPKKFLQKANDCALKIRNEIFEENDIKKIALWISFCISAIAPTVFSFILSQKELPFFTYPIGLSLISSAKGDTLFFFLGMLIFAISSKFIISFLS